VNISLLLILKGFEIDQKSCFPHILRYQKVKIGLAVALKELNTVCIGAHGCFGPRLEIKHLFAKILQNLAL
jgi:hypothetical protein